MIWIYLKKIGQQMTLNSMIHGIQIEEPYHSESRKAAEGERLWGNLMISKFGNDQKT